ncbi:unnamed protein product, partial [Musa hybrid cultivar]
WYICHPRPQRFNPALELWYIWHPSTSFSCLLTTIMASIKDEILLHDSVVAGHQTASTIIPRVTQPCSPIIIIPESGRIKNKQL